MGRQDYLHQTASAIFDANGRAVASLSPGMGQYWVPTFLRVATISSTGTIPYCIAYQGVPGDYSTTGYIDDTYLGNSDTSSIVAGTVCQPGESISAVWTSGTPGDTAILTVYGVTYDTPPSVSEMPTTPGTHFSGKPATVVSSEVFLTQSQIATPGGGLNFGPIDVRNWAAFTFLLGVTSPNANNYGMAMVTMSWYKDPAITTNIYQDSIEFFAYQSSGSFPCLAGHVYWQDICHSDFVLFEIYNTTKGTDNISITADFVVTSRNVITPCLRQVNSVSNQVGEFMIGDGRVLNQNITNLGAGLTISYPCPLYLGPAQLCLVSNTTYTIKILQGSYNNPVFQVSAVAGVGTYNVVLTKGASLVQITNTAGTAMTGTLTLVSQYDKL